MEEMNKVKNLAELFIEKIITLAEKIVTTMNSTVPQLISNIPNTDDTPELVKTILGLVSDFISNIPLLGTTTMIDLIFGSGIALLIAFMLIKFFAII